METSFPSPRGDGKDVSRSWLFEHNLHTTPERLLQEEYPVIINMLRKNRWRILPQYRNTLAGNAFSSLEKVCTLSDRNDRVTSDSESTVFRHNIAGTTFYVKRYHSTKGARSWLGKSRLRGEWNNLKLFSKLGIPTAPLVAYGEERLLLRAGKGALITESLPDTVDLAALATMDEKYLTNRQWVNCISRKVASYTRKLHDYQFAHNDLKWRNILVTTNMDEPQVFFIDCPTGQRWYWPLLQYRIIKDLACLDKLGKKHLSRSQRLRFFKQYKDTPRLSSGDKVMIRKILTFFEGRE